VRLSALLRDNDGKPVKAQPVFLRLKQPDGKTFRETRLQPGDQGYINFEQVIPPRRRPGAGRSSSAPTRPARKRSRA
jgi:uncharacterized protein YfaS (alpha-2-macroglobulin family)